MAAYLTHEVVGELPHVVFETVDVLDCAFPPLQAQDISLGTAISSGALKVIIPASSRQSEVGWCP